MIVRLTTIVIFLLTSVTGYAQSPVNLDDALEEALQTEKTQEEKRRSVTQLLDPGQLEAVLASRLDEEVQLSLQLIELRVCASSFISAGRPLLGKIQALFLCSK